MANLTCSDVCICSCCGQSGNRGDCKCSCNKCCCARSRIKVKSGTSRHNNKTPKPPLPQNDLVVFVQETGTHLNKTYPKRKQPEKEPIVYKKPEYLYEVDQNTFTFVYNSDLVQKHLLDSAPATKVPRINPTEFNKGLYFFKQKTHMPHTVHSISYTHCALPLMCSFSCTL